MIENLRTVGGWISPSGDVYRVLMNAHKWQKSQETLRKTLNFSWMQLRNEKGSIPKARSFFGKQALK